MEPSTLHVTPHFILNVGENTWNVWFGMKEGSEHSGCILYQSSFSSEYTWLLFNRPNGHWVTPGQPSNTLFKSHNTQAQDLWTRRARLFGGGGGHKIILIHYINAKTNLYIHIDAIYYYNPLPCRNGPMCCCQVCTMGRHVTLIEKIHFFIKSAGI